MLNLTNPQSRIINLKNLFNELNKLLHKTIILTYIVEINIIGHFLLIFDKFQNVTVFSKANISAATGWNCTCRISKFKLDIIQLNASYLFIISLVVFMQH